MSLISDFVQYFNKLENTLNKTTRSTVAPWPHKDIKLVTLKISIDPSHIWSTESKTVVS